MRGGSVLCGARVHYFICRAGKLAFGEREKVVFNQIEALQSLVFLFCNALTEIPSQTCTVTVFLLCTSPRQSHHRHTVTCILTLHLSTKNTITGIHSLVFIHCTSPRQSHFLLSHSPYGTLRHNSPQKPQENKTQTVPTPKNEKNVQPSWENKLQTNEKKRECGKQGLEGKRKKNKCGFAASTKIYPSPKGFARKNVQGKKKWPARL